MIITAYLDESGTHDGSELTLMAGYVGYSGQWRKFDKKWARNLARLRLTHFHAKDFVKGTGEFKGWSDKRKLSLLTKAEQLCRNHTLYGFAASFKNSDYDEFYVARERPKKVPLDSRYGLCFRLCLCFLPEMTRQMFGGHQPTMNIVLESGHKNSGDAARIFDLFKRQADPELVKLVGTLTFADKRKCMGVQGADSLAYSAYRVEQKSDLQVLNLFEFAQDDWSKALEYVKGQQPVFRLIGTPNILRGMRENVLDQIAARKHFGERKSIANSSVSAKNSA